MQGGGTAGASCDDGVGRVGVVRLGSRRWRTGGGNAVDGGGFVGVDDGDALAAAMAHRWLEV